MENNLLSTDITALKHLLDEPIYFIKSEFNSTECNTSADTTGIKESHFQLLGENKKNIVFIVFTSDKKLSEVEQDLMNKTLVGLKLTKKDIAFCFSTYDFSSSFELIASELLNQRIVCFGSSTHYNEDVLLKEIKIENSRILPCPALTELSNDQQLKIKWWTALKGFIN